MKPHVKEYFERYPNSPEVYETADGNLFHQDYEAKAHARNLDNKVVVRVENAEDDFYARLEAVFATQSVTLPAKGIDAIAPVVAEEDGTVISPAIGEFSTSPVAAEQVLDKNGVVVDAGTVDVEAPVTTEVVIEKEFTTDVPQEGAEVEEVADTREAEAKEATDVPEEKTETKAAPKAEKATKAEKPAGKQKAADKS